MYRRFEYPESLFLSTARCVKKKEMKHFINDTRQSHDNDLIFDNSHTHTDKIPLFPRS